MRLQKKLEECGCGNIDPDELRDVVQEAAAIMCPSVSWWKRVDYILGAPRELGVPFVNEVRKRIGNTRLPERIITQTLINIRKRKRNRQRV